MDRLNHLASEINKLTVQVQECQNQLLQLTGTLLGLQVEASNLGWVIAESLTGDYQAIRQRTTAEAVAMEIGG